MYRNELNIDALNQVAGGKLAWLNSAQEMEDSPIFEGLKNVIAETKSHLDLSKHNNMNELELRMLIYARAPENGEHCFTRDTCKAFIKKYLPLV